MRLWQRVKLELRFEVTASAVLGFLTQREWQKVPGLLLWDTTQPARVASMILWSEDTTSRTT